MNVEIINVGTELLLGEIVNTNATYLQKMCKELGFNVYYQTVVGDNCNRLEACLDIAFKRVANMVITTGGLGPTQDDLTKELSAKYLGLDMIYDEDEAKLVDQKCKFVTGNDVIPDNNFKQAYFPAGSFVLNNEVGTANGCVMSKDEKIIVNLPGPPKEMTFVVDNVLKPYLSKYKQDVIYTLDIVTMGIGESNVDEILRDLINEQEDVTIALYASEESVRIRLACKASNKIIADTKMLTTKKEIDSRLGKYILKDANLDEAIKKIMPKMIINYSNGFRLSDDFLNYETKNPGDILTIDIETTPVSLGEIVKVTLHYKDANQSFEIGLLKEASLSLNKLEAKIKSKVYTLLLTN